MIERYAFISFDMYELVRSRFPDAITYGNSKVVQYASPAESKLMKSLVDKYGLSMVHYSQTNSTMIISAIENGIDKIYNCDHLTALAVVNHFSKEI